VNLRDKILSLPRDAIRGDYGGLYIWAKKPDGKLTVNQQAISGDQSKMVSYLDDLDYIVSHEISDNPALMPYGVDGTASTRTCWCSSGCYYNEYPIFSTNTSVVTVNNPYNPPEPATVHAVGVGNATFTSTAEGIDATPEPVQVQCAVPTNYRQTAWRDLGDGVLEFDYEWNSSMGTDPNNGNLASCNFREFVTYPGYPNNPSYNPGPPFPSDLVFQNPTVTTPPFVMNAPGWMDQQRHGTNPFRTPYTAANFTAYQTHQWRCSCIDNNNWHTFNGFDQISIVRSVSQNGGVWTYKVTKSGQQATKTLP
jgi:hypothetical protein